MIEDKDFLTESEIKEIQDLVQDHIRFPWYFIPGHTPFHKNESEFFFSHSLYVDESPHSDFYYFFMSIFKKFLDKNELAYRSILRARVNLYTNTGIKSGYPHTDWNFDHNVFMYYINDSDGDTIFYDKTYSELGEDPINLRVTNRISPESGKGVVFDGSILHSASHPVLSNKRIILNISYL